VGLGADVIVYLDHIDEPLCSPDESLLCYPRVVCCTFAAEAQTVGIRAVVEFEHVDCERMALVRVAGFAARSVVRSDIGACC
jgi:hypothetical protein